MHVNDKAADNAGAPLPYEALAGEALPGRACPIASTLALIGEKWSLLALREVFLGNHRFNDIARNTGAPRDRLAARLRALVDAGILTRREYSAAPPRFSYHLTPAGAALSPVLRALIAWGNEWAVDTPPMTLLHRDHAFEPVESCAGCGDQVSNRELTVRVLNDGWSVPAATGSPAKQRETERTPTG